MTTTMSAWCFRSSMNCWGNSATLKRERESCDLGFSWVPGTIRHIALLVLQLDHRHAAAPLVGRRFLEMRHQRMPLEEAGDRAPQLTGAEAVDDADRSLIGQHRFVEEALGAGERLVDRAPDQVQLGERSGPRLQLDVHADTRPAH